MVAKHTKVLVAVLLILTAGMVPGHMPRPMKTLLIRGRGHKAKKLLEAVLIELEGD